ncbi:MAG TPA: FAD-dependent thymidylate synthase [Planctomycetota bacterium]|nr:FAD-dependent thymidylate synthase [Planctomycetota bacterium]
MPYSDFERRLLQTYFSVVDGSEHADIYLVRNLPGEVAATLNGVYSRSSKSMRDQFLDRLRQGLEAQGKKLEDLPIEAAATDLLSGVMADKSGQFLKTYAIDHGHNSLREGSVVHLAVERVSQLVTRFIQRERRCSFEESSTRYISFSAETHWRDPDVMADPELAKTYEAVLHDTFALYRSCSERCLSHLQKLRPLQSGEKEGPWLRTLKAEAFDAARYLLTPAIFTKWGMVVDARTLSDVVTELKSHALAEFRIVGERMQQQAEVALPTLLKHARPNAFLQALQRAVPALAADLGVARSPATRGAATGHTLLLAHDPELDDRLLASLLYEHSQQPFAALLARVKALTQGQRIELLDKVMAARGPHDAWPQALEGAGSFDFEVVLDFGAYRDVGRHRKGFQQQQALTTAHGFAVPPLVREAGLSSDYEAVLEATAARQQIIAERFPLAAGYVTPFAFLQRVRLVFDPRQVAYFIELRSGPEGHFSYRQVALDMLARVREVTPLFARYLRAKEGSAFLGRLDSEMSAEDRRQRRMHAAGDT